MATTTANNVGRTRKKLAQILAEHIPNLTLFPEDIRSQIPYYASSKMDYASWDADGQINGLNAHIFSWNTMGECIKGFEIKYHSHLDVEVYAKNELLISKTVSKIAKSV